jgi:Plasmid pRiA4b ORF-3-like protein
MTFLQEQEVAVSNVNQLIQLKFLPDLNQRLSHPTDVQLKRLSPKSYPYIQGLYLLLRMVGIAQILPQGKSQVLGIDPAAESAWQQLNPTEQYFTLLEAWLILADETVIGEHRGGGLGEPLYKLMLFWQRIPDTLKFASYKDQKQIHHFPGFHNLALLELFGLMAVQTGETAIGQGWRVLKIQKLPLGEAFIQLATQTFADHLSTDVFGLETFAPASFGLLHPPLQPFFPEWQTVWTLPGQGFHAGTYTFKISVGKVWRRVACSAETDLDDLAMAILDSYQFDADHLYEFSYRDRRGVGCQISHPACEDPPFTSEVKVGDLALAPGQAMKFWYDFGDNWKFKVELETITPTDPQFTHPTLLESHGKAPQQYRDYSDEDW